MINVIFASINIVSIMTLIIRKEDKQNLGCESMYTCTPGVHELRTVTYVYVKSTYTWPRRHHPRQIIIYSSRSHAIRVSVRHWSGPAMPRPLPAGCTSRPWRDAVHVTHPCMSCITIHHATVCLDGNSDILPHFGSTSLATCSCIFWLTWDGLLYVPCPLVMRLRNVPRKRRLFLWRRLEELAHVWKRILNIFFITLILKVILM